MCCLKMENISFHLITNDGNDSSHYGRGRVWCIVFQQFVLGLFVKLVII